MASKSHYSQKIAERKLPKENHRKNTFMLNWKRYAAVLAGLSVLALAGCGQSSGSGNPATAGPNAADEAAMANTKGMNPSQSQGAQAAAAKAKAGASATGGAKSPAGTTKQ